MDFNYSYFISPENNNYLNTGIVRSINIHHFNMWNNYPNYPNYHVVDINFNYVNTDCFMFIDEFFNKFKSNSIVFNYFLSNDYFRARYLYEIKEDLRFGIRPNFVSENKFYLLVPYNFFSNEDFILFDISKIDDANLIKFFNNVNNVNNGLFTSLGRSLGYNNYDSLEINPKDLYYKFICNSYKHVKEDDVHNLICPKKDKIYIVELKNLLNIHSLSKNEFDSYNTKLIKNMSDIFKECKSDTETDKLIYSLLNSGTMNDGSKLKIVTHFLNIEDQYKYYLNKRIKN